MEIEELIVEEPRFKAAIECSKFGDECIALLAITALVLVLARATARPTGLWPTIVSLLCTFHVLVRRGSWRKMRLRMGVTVGRHLICFDVVGLDEFCGDVGIGRGIPDDRSGVRPATLPRQD